MKSKITNQFKKELDLCTKSRSSVAAKHENITSGLEKSLNLKLWKFGSCVRTRTALSKPYPIQSFTFPLTT